jgi:hypothetical protein
MTKVLKLSGKIKASYRDIDMIIDTNLPDEFIDALYPDKANVLDLNLVLSTLDGKRVEITIEFK